MSRRKWVALLGLIAFFVISGWIWMGGSSDTAAVNGEDLSELNLEIQPFAYTNQANEVVSNTDLEGKYSLVNMIFTRCPTVCNLMTPNMTELQSDIAAAGLDVNLISFTVDPEHDTPEILQEYGENYEADFSNWDLLTGYSVEEITAMAHDSFNSVVQKREENDDIIHSTELYLINENGEVIRSYDALEVDQTPVIEDLQALSSEEA